MTLTPDPAVLAWLDQEDRRTAETIRRFGVSIEYVSGDARSRETSFAYTIGLFGVGHPEVLVLGLDPRTAALLLNDVAGRVRTGGDLSVGELLEFDGWSHRVTVERVPNPGDIAFAANRFYQRPDAFSVELLQLTYDDRDGRFPWEDGYARAEWIQPRPGAFRA
jgi:hypothetical protein